VVEERAGPELEPFATRIPAELRRDIKVAAARKDMSVQDVTIEALSQWLERNSK
jgi:predicted HicB family RNase H-like nuclease